MHLSILFHNTCVAVNQPSNSFHASTYKSRPCTSPKVTTMPKNPVSTPIGLDHYVKSYITNNQDVTLIHYI